MSDASTNLGPSNNLGRTPLLAFVMDDATEQALRGGLGNHVDNINVRHGDIDAAIKVLARESTPQVLIIDLTGLEQFEHKLDALAAVCSPDVRLLLVGDRTDVGFYRKMIRDIGAVEYLHKPLTRDNVTRLFGPVVLGSGQVQPADRGGSIITVGGARGGVGATTIATNLALELAEATHGHVALLDLHLRGGTAAMMLGAQPGAGLRLALEQPDRIDALLLERIAVPVSDRMRVISAEEPFDVDPAPTAEGIERLLMLLRLHFNIIVVDAPMPPTGVERAVLRAARHRVLVMAPEVGSIRDTQAARQLVSSYGGSSRVITVLNRANMPGGLSSSLVKEGLQSDPDVVIPDLPKQLPKAANLGNPALHASSVFRRALQPLVREVSGVGTEPTAVSLMRRLGIRSSS